MRISNLSLITWVRIVALVSLTFLVVGGTLTSYLSQQGLLREFEKDREKPAQDARLITWKMDVHLERLEQELLRLARVEDLKEAVAKMDRRKLLEQARPPLNRLRRSPLRVERISFYLPSGTVFLKAHDSELYADDLSGHRVLIAEVANKRRVVRGVEPEGNTFFLWAATPVYQQGRVIGIMEMGTPMSFFIQEVKSQLGAEVGLFTQNGASTATLVPVEATERTLVGSIGRLLEIPAGITAPKRQVVTAAGRTYAVSLIPIEKLSLYHGLVLAVLFDVTRFTQLLNRNTASLIGISACGFLIAAILIIFLTQKLENARRILEAKTVELVAAKERELREAEVLRERRRTEEEIRRSLERIQALHEIDLAITSSLNLHDVLSVLLEKIDLFLPYSTATVKLYTKNGGLLEPVACWNLDEQEWKLEQWKAGRGPANEVFENKLPMMIRNCCTDPRVRDPDFFRKHALVSYMGAPLIVKGETLGVLSFYTKEEHEFTGEEIEFVSTLAGQAAIAIHNSQLYKDVQRREQQIQEGLKQLQALYAITTTANQSLDLDIVLNEVIRKVTEIFGFDATRIFIFDHSMQTLLLKASYQTSPQPFVTENSFRRGQGIVGRAADANDPIIFEDIRNDPKYLEMSHMGNTRRTGFRFLAAFPIKSKRDTLGAISFFGHKSRSLIANEIELLKAMAGQIGIAVQNARLFEETAQRADDLTLHTLDLERANKVKDEFLSIMSHELRTPLNVMMGYTGLLKEGMFGRINPEQDDALAKVTNQANDLLSIMNDVLRATQIGSGVTKATKAKVNLSEFLDELKMAYDVPMRKELTISWDYPSDLPDAETDSEKLKHVLQNLINNAIKFTDKGQVRISARYLPQAKIVKFKVADTGIGIAKESLPIIFDMFHQGDASDTRLHGGVGLGLYIVKKYTELLGGEVKVRSDPGIGSVFTVVIPSQTQASTPKLNLAILEEGR